MPGKFANECDEIVWDMSMVGCDAECGDVSYGDGWFGLLTFNPSEAAIIKAAGTMDTRPIGAIVNEDGQGFVTVDYFDDTASLPIVWAEIVAATDDSEGE